MEANFIHRKYTCKTKPGFLWDIKTNKCLKHRDNNPESKCRQKGVDYRFNEKTKRCRKQTKAQLAFNALYQENTNAHAKIQRFKDLSLRDAIFQKLVKRGDIISVEVTPEGADTDQDEYFIFHGAVRQVHKSKLLLENAHFFVDRKEVKSGIKITLPTDKISLDGFDIDAPYDFYLRDTQHV
jgi:hypothetical protein